MKLIFVYNADSGMLNTMKDITHKLLSPATYDCFLCSLTHGTFRENPQWKDFRSQSKCEMVFLHRDEFENQYGQQMEYPVILRENGSLEPVITKNQLAEFTNLDDLIESVKALESPA